MLKMFIENALNNKKIKIFSTVKDNFPMIIKLIKKNILILNKVYWVLIIMMEKNQLCLHQMKLNALKNANIDPGAHSLNLIRIWNVIYILKN